MGGQDVIVVGLGAVGSAALFALAGPHLRIAAPCVRALACRYAVTPDFHFIIDRVPGTERAWFASACSGHGFKHSPAVGEALAELAVDRSPFGRGRFAAAGS